MKLGSVWNIRPIFDRKGTERKWEYQNMEGQIKGKPGLIISNEKFSEVNCRRRAVVHVTNFLFCPSP